MSASTKDGNLLARIRILHLIETLGRGGAERLLYTNLSKLDRARFDSTVCTLYEWDSHWRQPILDLGYPVLSLGMTSLQDVFRGLFRLIKILQRDPVDMIHTHLYGANLLGRLAGWLTHVRVVSSIHNPDYDPALLQYNQGLSPLKLDLLRLGDRLTIRLADPEFIAVSKQVERSAIEHLNLSPARIQVIYNSVDPDYFDPVRQNDGAGPSELAFLEGPVLLTIARYDPQKGLQYLIDAVAALTAQFPALAAFFIGGGSEAARLAHQRHAERAAVATHCRFLGPQEDIRPYLKRCDVFVLPSLYEGFGISLVEAMAMERACVATRVSAIPEIVANGQSGLLVKPAHPDGLAKAIGDLLGNATLRLRMGTEGRRLVLERFNIGQKVCELETLYERLHRK